MWWLYMGSMWLEDGTRGGTRIFFYVKYNVRHKIQMYTIGSSTTPKFKQGTNACRNFLNYIIFMWKWTTKAIEEAELWEFRSSLCYRMRASLIWQKSSAAEYWMIHYKCFVSTKLQRTLILTRGTIPKLLWCCFLFHSLNWKHQRKCLLWKIYKSLQTS